MMIFYRIYDIKNKKNHRSEDVNKLFNGKRN